MQLSLFAVEGSTKAKHTSQKSRRKGTIISSPALPFLPDLKLPYSARSFFDLPQWTANKNTRKKQNQQALTSDDPAFLFQNFSGLGGLHDVEFKGFAHFHDYTQAKQAFEMGQFFTPAPLAKLIVEMLEIEPGKKIADLCCGNGQFFNFLKDCEVSGLEIDQNAYQVAKKLYPHAQIQHADIRDMRTISSQHYMVGNPPFNLVWDGACHPLASEQGRLLSQDYWLYKCHQFLLPGGFLAFICPQTWLTDELRHKKARAFVEASFHQVFEVSLPRNAFKTLGISNFATKILCFQKYIPNREMAYPPCYLTFQNALSQWRRSNTYDVFQTAKTEAHTWQIKNKFAQYLREERVPDDQRKAYDRYKKLLFELKRSRPDKVAQVETEKQAIETASKPEGMAYDTWVRQRPTLPKLLKKMRRYLKPNPEKDLIRLVKKDGALCLKPYSFPAKKALTQSGLPTQWNLHKLINKDYWKADWDSFIRTLKQLNANSLTYRTKRKATRIHFESFSATAFFRQKHVQFRNQRADVSQLNPPKAMLEKLEKLSLGAKKLYPHQVVDIAKALSKPATLLNWEMGTGKTLSAIAWAKLRGGKTLVVAPSLLIRKTWREEFASIHEEQIQIIESFNDLETAKHADFVLISLERLPRFYKRLKSIKFHNLIVDESDNVKNPASIRAKALKAVARRIGHKLFLTGTFTRNNATEAFNQLALLLNHTTSFLSEVPKIAVYDPHQKEIVYEPNPQYQLPFPARGGHALFRKNFSPKKTTVFGAEKTNQELYNKKALLKLIKSVRLRRRFQEVKPDHVTYDIQQITVPMTEAEKHVYSYIFEAFVRELEHFYNQDHCGRVSKMLVLMRQITALLQAVSHPWTFSGYDGDETTSKMQKVLEIVRNNPDKKIMFGTPWKPTAKRYAEVLSQNFKVVYLDSDLSISKRNALIQKFREGDDKVLISTMGVLKAGVNIPEAEIVITDSYPWNYAQLSQYFFRAIRLNSENHTQVYCLSNEGSFDTNVFNLLIAKERVNKFIQDEVNCQNTDIAKAFGVNDAMLESAIQLVKEKVNGKTRASITWGQSVLTDHRARIEQ